MEEGLLRRRGAEAGEQPVRSRKHLILFLKSGAFPPAQKGFLEEEEFQG